MTVPDRPPDPLPVTHEQAVAILEQAELAVQAGAPLSVGLRAMATEIKPPVGLLFPALIELALIAVVILIHILWVPYFTTAVILCSLAGLSIAIAWTYSSFRAARTSGTLMEMARRLEEGVPLPESLTILGSRVSPFLRTLLEHGAAIGRFDTVLHWAAEQGRRHRSLHWTMWFTLSYPLFLLGAGCAVSSFLLIGIVPNFKRIFDDFGTQLPEITQVLIGVSDFLVNYGILFTGVALLFLTVAFILTVSSGQWLVTQKWSPYVPIIGPLFHLETLAEFCDLLAVFVECQVPTPKALRLASQATRDQWLQTACGDLANDIEAGHPTETSGQAVGIPVAISQLLREGSDPQPMAEALRGLSDLYANRVDIGSSFIAIVAEPFVVLIVSVGLASTVFALYLPLVKLLNDLS